MKRCILITMVVVLMLSCSVVVNADNGYVESTEANDADLFTYVVNPNGLILTLDSPTYVDYFDVRWRRVAGGGWLKLTWFDSSGNQLGSEQFYSYDAGTYQYIVNVDPPVQVAYIQIDTIDCTAYLYEISYVVADTSQPPGDITGLNATVTYDTVTLTWNNPTDSDFSHVDVYRDGVLIATGITAGTYTDTGLSSSTKYTYKVVAVDTYGNESNGVTIDVTTDDVLKLINSIPADGSSYVPVDTNIELTFNKPLDYSVSLSNVQLLDENMLSVTVTGYVYHDEGRIVLVPEQTLQNDTQYTVEYNVTSSDGQQINSSINFKTIIQLIGNQEVDTILAMILAGFDDVRSGGILVVASAVGVGLVFVGARWLWKTLRKWLKRSG